MCSLVGQQLPLLHACPAAQSDGLRQAVALSCRTADVEREHVATAMKSNALVSSFFLFFGSQRNERVQGNEKNDHSTERNTMLK